MRRPGEGGEELAVDRSISSELSDFAPLRDPRPWSPPSSPTSPPKPSSCTPARAGDRSGTAPASDLDQAGFFPGVPSLLRARHSSPQWLCPAQGENRLEVVAIREQLERNRNVKDSKFRLILVESRMPCPLLQVHQDAPTHLEVGKTAAVPASATQGSGKKMKKIGMVSSSK